MWQKLKLSFWQISLKMIAFGFGVLVAGCLHFPSSWHTVAVLFPLDTFSEAVTGVLDGGWWWVVEGHVAWSGVAVEGEDSGIYGADGIGPDGEVSEGEESSVDTDVGFVLSGWRVVSDADGVRDVAHGGSFRGWPWLVMLT